MLNLQIINFHLESQHSCPPPRQISSAGLNHFVFNKLEMIQKASCFLIIKIGDSVVNMTSNPRK